MARKKSRDLTEAELRLMDVIWQKGPATVAEVADALPKQLGLAYNTVLTTMRILEDKGYLKHTRVKKEQATAQAKGAAPEAEGVTPKAAKEGRAFVYEAVVGQQEASRKAVLNLLNRFFGDSPGELVLNLLKDEDISPQELKRIRKMIAEDSLKGER